MGNGWGAKEYVPRDNKGNMLERPLRKLRLQKQKELEVEENKA
jgi:hypothetical protein